MKKLFCLLTLLLLQNSLVFPQEEIQAEDSIEVFLIDNFVTADTPAKLKLSFFTNVPAKSKVIIDQKDEFTISDSYKENHSIEINITKLNLDDIFIPFIILVEDSAGNVNESESYDFEIPKDIEVEGESNILMLCLFGGAVFGLPYPAYVSWGEENYFSLTKEIPIIFIPSSGYTYPTGYFSAEYSHIINAPVKNLLRFGYKHLIEVPGIEYVSPGVNGFTNFKGFNGISPELSFGLFKIFNTFTVYTRYRFNAKPGEPGSEFHEISLGLYSGFFAIYL